MGIGNIPPHGMGGTPLRATTGVGDTPPPWDNVDWMNQTADLNVFKISIANYIANLEAWGKAHPEHSSEVSKISALLRLAQSKTTVADIHRYLFLGPTGDVTKYSPGHPDPSTAAYFILKMGNII